MDQNAWIRGVLMTDSQRAALIQRYVDEYAALLFLRLDSQGMVVDANRFTRKRIGNDWRRKTYRTIFLFSDKGPDPAELRKDPDRVHLVHMATNAGLPETFRVQFFAEADETLVFGSIDAEETMRLRKEMTDLNNRLNALTRELQKKNHQLEELNRLKNQFLGMAAHDLRKPVGAILSYTEFLLDETEAVLDREHLGFLKTIHGSTAFMQGIIDDFLDISMIESGRFELRLSLTDMRKVIERSAALNLRIGQKKGVTIEIICNQSVPLVMMDALKIEQVLNNLVSNAIEHSPEDAVVEVRLSTDEAHVVVSVRDSGPGIAPEERETLFKPFVRGVSVKSAGSKSTGLGLAISKKIVESHSGRIWTEDNPGGGAVFGFRVPFNTEKGGATK
ncbi:MAG: HAMP domain-containing histidine kinase [Candidatus Aminicenantes bacterium]|nr:HAMP domain-containing histidine kinase [Candidatus Aminicenantes bacterium]